MSAILNQGKHGYTATECWTMFEMLQSWAIRFANEGSYVLADWADAASLEWETRALDAHWQNRR